MPKTKIQLSGNKPLPANQQKGKKQCTCCHKPKNMTDFYFSSSPMYSLDERIPVCKECCKTSVLAEDGRIDFDKFKDLLRNIDKPLYFDLLFSSEESIKKENSYLSDEEVSLHGYEILQKYFTLVAMRQDKAKSYSDAEKEGFIHQNSNYYDQLKGVGSQWATNMSIKAIKENGIFDENDKKEIYEIQLDMIAALNKEVDELKEKIRILTLENDKLKAGVD